MSDEHLRAGFVRARRFLIGVSLGLACLNVLGLKFNEVSILGNSAEIRHPEHIAVLAWIAWVWALVQYVVWFRDVGVWKEFMDTIREECSQRLGRRIAQKPISERARDQLARELANTLGASELKGLEYRAKFTNIDDAGGEVGRAAQIECTALVRLPDHYVGRSSTLRIEIPITSGQWRGQFLQSAILTLVSRRFVPEYFAPLLIALLPLIV
jgi:hypothetical protein